jgi:cytochrome c oxidase subunit IV
MTDTTIEATHPAGDDAGEAAGHDAHPSDGHYIKIALVLAALTAAETATYYIDFFEENTGWLLVTLLPMMAFKFGLVAWYFMHLKSDSRLFSQVFVAGIVMASVLYIVMLLTYEALF